MLESYSLFPFCPVENSTVNSNHLFCSALNTVLIFIDLNILRNDSYFMLWIASISFDANRRSCLTWSSSILLMLSDKVA